MRKLLVTGGAGFIGSHTCAALTDAGFSVVIIDDLSNSSADSICRIKEITGVEPFFYKADIRDRETLDRIFSEHSIDAVIHFAGLKSVAESVAEPMKYYRNNVFGTMQLIDAMENAGCKKLVFSSSATVYGDMNTPPYTEDMRVGAVNPYGQTKLMIEQMLMDLCESDTEWSVAALRYFNPVGAHKSGLLGEAPFGTPSNLVPCIADTLMGKQEYLSVYGNDYETADGTAIRDYIHIMDLAEGHIAALREYNDKYTGFRAFNLGTGCGSSVLEVIREYERASGMKIPIVFKPRRQGDAAVSYADASRAENELHWKANLGLSEMCLDSWRYVSQSNV